MKAATFEGLACANDPRSSLTAFSDFPDARSIGFAAENQTLIAPLRANSSVYPRLPIVPLEKRTRTKTTIDRSSPNRRSVPLAG
jgi:hypothetical protein